MPHRASERGNAPCTPAVQSSLHLPAAAAPLPEITSQIHPLQTIEGSEARFALCAREKRACCVTNAEGVGHDLLPSGDATVDGDEKVGALALESVHLRGSVDPSAVTSRITRVRGGCFAGQKTAWVRCSTPPSRNAEFRGSWLSGRSAAMLGRRSRRATCPSSFTSCAGRASAALSCLTTHTFRFLTLKTVSTTSRMLMGGASASALSHID
jgi:hypothetical protein